MDRAGPAGGHARSEARGLAIGLAAQALDAELECAPVDEHFALVLRACAHGGQRALRELCDAVDDPALEIVDTPALALVEAIAGELAAARGVRAAAWVMAAQRIAETWPGTWFDVLSLAREAMALDEDAWERVRGLAMLTTGALGSEDPGEREGLHFQFSRESLENVIGAATGRRPVRRDMLHVIPYWTRSFISGTRACDEHLRVLEATG